MMHVLFFINTSEGVSIILLIPYNKLDNSVRIIIMHIVLNNFCLVTRGRVISEIQIFRLFEWIFINNIKKRNFSDVRHLDENFAKKYEVPKWRAIKLPIFS